MLKAYVLLRRARDKKRDVRLSIKRKIANRRLEKIKKKYSKENSVKWIAEDIMRYVVLEQPVTLNVCSIYHQSTLNLYYKKYVKRIKSRKAIEHHSPLNVDFQNEITDYIKSTNLFEVREFVNKSFDMWEGYDKTIKIDFKRRG